MSEKISRNLPNKIYEEALNEILTNNLEESLSEYVIEYSAGSSKGDNYVGIVYRIQVKENDEILLSLIAKLPPENEARRQLTDVHTCFTRESNFYNIIYPEYKKFQREKGIDIKNCGFYQVPICYKTLNDEPYEGQFFEDLKALGFEMFDRLKEVTKEHVFLVMKALAKMHALYFCIKDQKPEIIRAHGEMTDHFIKQCEKDNSAVNVWLESLKEQALRMLENSRSNNVTERIKTVFKDSFFELYRKCIQNADPYKVWCHGDCWNNNVMFKYDQEGHPCDVRLIDFQIMRFAPPVTDLMYYIFGCTTKSLRNEHYQDFIDVYYRELSTFIIKLGSNPSALYPEEIFKKQLKDYGIFGLLIATLLIPIITSDPSETPDMDEISESIQQDSPETVDVSAAQYTSAKTYDLYAQRMMDVCVDMYDLGYI